jgi:pyruvate dehydrogenase E2 component (dihydrolipoamide acetyltransferase)
MAESIIMPRLGDFMTEGVVTSWEKSAGEKVVQGEPIAQIESEKLNYELEAAADGILHPLVNAGDTVAVDAILGYLLEEGEKPPELNKVTNPPPEKKSAQILKSEVKREDNSTTTRVPSTPGARRLAKHLGVDLSKVNPTGPRGRIVEADVRGFHESANPSDDQGSFGLPDPVESKNLDGMRGSIARHMKGSLSSTAQLSFFLEIDVTEAQKLRRELKIGLPILLIKASSEAIKRVPKINSVIQNNQVSYFDQIDIGFAVALDEGLIVPVIRGVQEMNVRDISSKVETLTRESREGNLSTDDVVGGTFTISVLGVVDGFTPILNSGQSALLGIGRSVEKPVVKNKEVAIREMMTISLTVDHQVIDGAVAAAFLRRFQQLIERPHGLK